MTWFPFIRFFSHDLRQRSYPTLELDLDFGTTKLFTILEHAQGRSQALHAYQDFTIIQNQMREPVNP